MSILIQVFLFTEFVVLEVSEEFNNVSGVQEQTIAKKSSESNVTNNTDISHRICTTGLQYHQKLCKVSVGENFPSSEQVQSKKQDNSDGLLLKDVSKNPHKTEKDSLHSVMEKLVESAHFGKLGKSDNFYSELSRV